MRTMRIGFWLGITGLLAGLAGHPAWAGEAGAAPPDLLAAIEAAQLAVEPEADGRYRAENPGNRLQFHFGADALAVSSTADGQAWRWGLRLTGYGAPDHVVPAPPARLEIRANRIEYQRGAMTEWYENRRAGLEQGFTLAEPPEPGAGAAVLRFTVEGGLMPELSADGRSVAYALPDGREVLSYSDLKVVDAQGRSLPAHLVAAGHTLNLEFDVHGAAWPVVVDPLVKSAAAFASDGSGTDYFGFSAAISGDTAVIGAPADNFSGTARGSVDVFLRSSGAWARQKQHLVPTTTNASEYFGFAVAVYGDTAVVGAPRYPTTGSSASRYRGRAVVFTRSGTTWTQQAVLAASDAAGGDYFGAAVAVYGDTAVIGAPGEDTTPNTNNGAVYVFTRSGTVWTQRAKKTKTTAATNYYFGAALALSGNRILVGAPGYMNSTFWTNTASTTLTGQAEVFTGSGATWTSEGTLPASGLAAQDRFGWSVDLYQLNNDPIEALVGAPYHDTSALSNSGAAYAFVYSTGAWSQQAMLQKTTPVASDQFGYAVALSEETAVVGVPYASSSTGAAYVFSHGTGSAWVNQQTLGMADASGFTAASNNQFGAAVALAGNAAVIGVPGRLSNQGAASFYTFPCAFGRSYALSSWSLLALPCQPAAAIANVGGVFGEGNTGNSHFLNAQFESTSTFHTGNWTIWQRDPTQISNTNIHLTSLTDTVAPGAAYWFLSQTAPTSNGPIGALTPNSPESTATPVVTGNPRCVSANGCYEFTLVPYVYVGPNNPANVDYNMVGFPLPYDVDWADVRLQVESPASTFTGYTPSAAETANYMSKNIWVWNGSAYQVFDDAATPGTLRVMRAFFVKMLAGSSGAVSLKLLIPAKPTLKTSARPAELPWYLGWLDWLAGPAEAADLSWRIRLTVANQTLGLVDPGNWVGQLPGSVAGQDPSDLKEMAPAGSPWLTIVFPHADWVPPGGYTTDYRGVSDTSLADRTWLFELRADSSQLGQAVYLSWEGERSVLERCVLTDSTTGQTYRLAGPDRRADPSAGIGVVLSNATSSFLAQPFSLYCLGKSN